MKNFRTLMIVSAIIEVIGFALVLLSTDTALLLIGVAILMVGSTVGGLALVLRTKEHADAVRYPAGDIQDVVFFDS